MLYFRNKRINELGFKLQLFTSSVHKEIFLSNPNIDISIGCYCFNYSVLQRHGFDFEAIVALILILLSRFVSLLFVKNLFHNR